MPNMHLKLHCFIGIWPIDDLHTILADNMAKTVSHAIELSSYVLSLNIHKPIGIDDIK